MAKKRLHISVERVLESLLLAVFPPALWTIDLDVPLELRDGFEPQPDLMVLRGIRADYLNRVPTPADVALLVEVSGSTYYFDSGEYLAEYARGEILLYWIVNLSERQVEVYSDPDPTRGIYRSRVDYAAGAAIPIAGQVIAADDLLRYIP